MQDIERRQLREVEAWLLDTEAKRQEYVEKMLTLPRTDSGLVQIPQGAGGNTTDKTSRAAIERADTQAYYQGWLSFIRDVEAALPCYMLVLLQLKRQRLKFRDMQHSYSREMQVRIGRRVPYYSRDYFGKAWRRLVGEVAREAEERGLFREYEKGGGAGV